MGRRRVQDTQLLRARHPSGTDPFSTDQHTDHTPGAEASGPGIPGMDSVDGLGCKPRESDMFMLG